MQASNLFAVGEYRSPWRLAGLEAPAPVLLALSGGADSGCLLHILAEESRRQGYSLTLAHVNHGIRGEEALRDRAFCEALAKHYGLELFILDADVPGLARESGRGLEEEARLVRYGFFEGLMTERGIPILATAHHADDQLETVLFHLSRGSGLRGLCGISPCRPFGQGWVVRPLLDVPRTSILQYCARHGLEYVTDSTNQDTAYARNRIRAEIVPIMEELFSSPQTRVAHMSRGLREDEELLDSLARDFLRKHTKGEDLFAPALRESHPAIGKRALMRWMEEHTCRTPEREPLCALWELLTNGKKQASVCFAGEITVSLEGDRVRLRQGTPAVARPFCVPFACGETVLPDSGIRILVERDEENAKIHNLSTASTIKLTITSDIMENGIFWRSRAEGDVLLQRGMHRKVRKLYHAAGIPLSVRERIPLLCDGEGILWAPFVGMRDGVSKEGMAYRIQVILPRDLSCGEEFL